MYIADMLSRAYLQSTAKSRLLEYQLFQMRQEERLYAEIENINQSSYLRIKDTTQLQIKKSTQTLKTVVLGGWPEQRDEVPVCIREYFAFRDEITVQDGTLYKGMRVIVPKSMQNSLKSSRYRSLPA